MTAAQHNQIIMDRQIVFTNRCLPKW